MKYKSPNIGSFKALLPFLIFIAIYLGAGIYFQMQGVDMAFYQFPSVTAMFIAVLSAFCLGSEPIMFKFGIFSKGAANDNIMTMLIGADLLIQTNKYHKKSNRTLILIMQPLELR